jgi:hypothetical protein
MENAESVKATPQAEPRSDTAVGSNPLLGRWVVSVVMLQHKPNGKLNILNHLWMIDAVSPEEAHGKAVGFANADHPEHLIHRIADYTIKLPNDRIT